MRVYASYGTNLVSTESEALALFNQASEHIQSKIEERNLGKVLLDKESLLYKTEPVGCAADSPWFYNILKVYQIVDGLCTAEDFLRASQEEEIATGRVRTYKNSPRLLDIDIIFFGNEKIRTENLEIPHRAYKERAFVLLPLADCLEDGILPTGEQIASLLENINYKLVTNIIYQKG